MYNCGMNNNWAPKCGCQNKGRQEKPVCNWNNNENDIDIDIDIDIENNQFIQQKASGNEGSCKRKQPEAKPPVCPMPRCAVICGYPLFNDFHA
ncbi:hypothetical protein RBG61_09630 [Paludicola sp. MB14-C6]|uniref:hypothetical protein n=1 Tax=Paludihabitans sp. MB14-C6 TaxID=3070656 RepID=UPI0027DD001C|nr:hypothetical protein [Paludicola sp. MB14-C6]WMJ22248.1 hypothetical protein RBG61_09630 [Paludicola sp. MB14-C6]